MGFINNNLKMFNTLSDDLIQYIIGFLNLYLEHDIQFIKEKIISLEIYFLKQVNKLLNKNIELFFKNKLKIVFVISYTITNYYNDIIKTLYFNEIAKIGNVKMYNNFNGINIIEKYDKIINNASSNGNISILEWFKNSGFEFKYDEYAINNASENGHIHILEWFKNSGFEFKYDEWAINYASKNGHIHILEWFKNSEFEFKYTEYAINYASKNGHIHILEWFKNSGFEFKYDAHAINYASENGHIHILE